MAQRLIDADFANPAAAPAGRRSNVRPTQPSVIWFVAPLAMTLAMALAGCAVGVGYDEPEWDGGVVVVEGGGYGRGYDRDHHAQAFHPEAGRGAAAGSARGRASMGARAGGGGHR
jgi:hypothetical protein